MATQHTVHVAVGDDRLDVQVFDQIDVVLDMFSVGSPFAMTVSWAKDTQSAYRRILPQLKFGSLVTIALDDAIQLSGRIETITEADDRGRGASVTFAGRDTSAVAIDWDADPRVAIRGLSLEDAFHALLDPLGVAVQIGADVDAARRVNIGTSRSTRSISAHPRRSHVDRSRPQPGERVWQVCERIAKRMGYMLWVAPNSIGQMMVVVDVPSYSSETVFQLRRVIGADGMVTADSNILSSTHEVSIRNVPTDVTVFTNAPRGATDTSRIASSVSNGWIFNPDVMGGFQTQSGLIQPRYVKAREARTLSAAEQEATRILSDANMRSRSYTARVQGLGQFLDSFLYHYAINAKTHVRDDLWGIDEDMLLDRVHFQVGRHVGTVSELHLHTLGAVQLTPDTTGDG